MVYEKIQLEMRDGLAIIRLNDPAKLNAFTLEMVREIDAALTEIEGTARALLVTSVGRAFSSGANLAAEVPIAEDGLPDIALSLETDVNPLMVRLSRLPYPWVSAVRGPAAGVGCALALAADLIVASESAYFLQAFAKIGLVPDGGSSWLLSRAIGRVRAMEMMMLGERLPAAKALEWGLINRLVADDQLEEAGLALAAGLAQGPTRSLAGIREAAWAATDADWVTTLAAERRLQRAAGRTADHQEGVAAFLEKRAPRFTGA